MNSLSQFMERFDTVDACLKHLEAVRWGSGEFCPLCGGSETIYHYVDGRRHKCSACRRTFRIITGTVFGDSPIKMLPKWFAAIWLETCRSKGISSVRLAKEIGVTQKTAWYMLKRIRKVERQDSERRLVATMEAGNLCVDGIERARSARARPQAPRLNSQDQDTRRNRSEVIRAAETTPQDDWSVALGLIVGPKYGELAA